MTISHKDSHGSVLIVTMPASPLESSAQLEAFQEWLRIWGILPSTPSPVEKQLLKRFSFFTWPKTDIENAHGPQLVPRIAEQSAELAAALSEKRPTLLIFLSCYLWQAMNLSRKTFEAVAGMPINEGRRITDLRLSAYSQRWQQLSVLALPMPSKNTTRSYIESLSQGVQEIFRTSGNLPAPSSDPLLEKAARELVLDRHASIERIRLNLHVDARRAEQLFEALEGLSYRFDGDQPLTSV